MYKTISMSVNIILPNPYYQVCYVVVYTISHQAHFSLLGLLVCFLILLEMCLSGFCNLFLKKLVIITFTLFMFDCRFSLSKYK